MYRESTVTRRKSGLKSTVWSRRKKKTFNQNRMKKQEFKKKNEERLRNLWDSLKHSNTHITGESEEEEEQEIEKLFEKLKRRTSLI